MKGARKYVIILTVLVLAIAALTYVTQPPQEWVPTWSALDKDPFGGYVTHKLLESQAPGRVVSSEYKSLYEMLDAVPIQPSSPSLLITNSTLTLDENDTEALLDYVYGGNVAFIAAQSFYGLLADSLGIASGNHYDAPDLSSAASDAMGTGGIDLQFTIPGFPERSFTINKEASTGQFEKKGTNASVLAKNEDGAAILQQFNVGNGKLYVSANPLLLTNFYALDPSSSEFTAGLLSLLPPDRDVIHVEFYTLGRMESRTPFRYMLSHPALKMALWLAVIGIFLFLIFEARRRQRIIPIVKAPTNLSVEFVNTLGQLYYSSRGDHTNLATKRMNYFLEYVRRHYFISTNMLDEQFVKELSAKSNKDETKVKRLIDLLNRVKAGQITQEEFLRMEVWLSDFYGDSQNT